MPQGRKATYGRIVVDYRPQKADPNRTRLTVGGDRVEYPHDVSTPTADMVTAKLLFNSVISTEGAKFLTVDIKNFSGGYSCQQALNQTYRKTRILSMYTHTRAMAPPMASNNVRPGSGRFRNKDQRKGTRRPPYQGT